MSDIMGRGKYREYSRLSTETGIFPVRQPAAASGNFPDMSTLAQRIQSRLNVLNLKAAAVAREAGLKPDYIRDILRGSKDSVSASNAVVLARLLECDLNWLLTGEGSNTSPHETPPVQPGRTKERKSRTNSFPEFTGEYPGSVPEVDARAGAGTGTVGEHQVVTTRHGETYLSHKVVSEWVFPSPFLRHELHTQPGNIIVLEVIGDSMSPTVESGDRLIVDTGHARPTPDGIYVLDEGHGPMVKRVELVRRSDPAEIRIISDNRNHQPYTMRLDEIRIVGRVSGRITKM